MSKVFSLIYGVAAYAVFFAVFIYAIGFIGGFGTPTKLDGALEGTRLGALEGTLLGARDGALEGT